MGSKTSVPLTMHVTLDVLPPISSFSESLSAVWLSGYISEPQMYFKVTNHELHRLGKAFASGDLIFQHVAYDASILQPKRAALAKWSPDWRFFTLPYNFTATGKWKDTAYITEDELKEHRRMDVPNDYKVPKDMDLRRQSPPATREKRERERSVDTPNKKLKSEEPEVRINGEEMAQKLAEQKVKFRDILENTSNNYDRERATLWHEQKALKLQISSLEQGNSQLSQQIGDLEAKKVEVERLLREEEQARALVINKNNELVTQNEQSDREKGRLEAEKTRLQNQVNLHKEDKDRIEAEKVKLEKQLGDIEDLWRKRVRETCDEAVTLCTNYAVESRSVEATEAQKKEAVEAVEERLQMRLPDEVWAEYLGSAGPNADG